MISGYNKERLGDQEVTVTYGGETAKFIVNVKDYVTGITITKYSKRRNRKRANKINNRL